MPKLKTIIALLAFVTLSESPAVYAQQSGTVDFSCMKTSVRGKIQVTDRHKEYDVVLDNRCPGPVYWKMCIERIDPWSRKIVEAHTPSGYLEADKRSRVNMQMKRGPDGQYRNRFQQFYVNAAFAIDSAANVSCVARQCEEQNKPLLKQIQDNERAIQKAENDITARVEAECPDSGWDGTVQKNCEAEIREVSKDSLELLEQTDQQLHEQLANTAPAYCQLHGGALVQYED